MLVVKGSVKLFKSTSKRRPCALISFAHICKMSITFIHVDLPQETLFSYT